MIVLSYGFWCWSVEDGGYAWRVDDENEQSSSESSEKAITRRASYAARHFDHVERGPPFGAGAA
jgi:hypothetical protein